MLNFTTFTTFTCNLHSESLCEYEVKLLVNLVKPVKSSNSGTKLGLLLPFSSHEPTKQTNDDKSILSPLFFHGSSEANGYRQAMKPCSRFNNKLSSHNINGKE